MRRVLTARALLLACFMASVACFTFFDRVAMPLVIAPLWPSCVSLWHTKSSVGTQISTKVVTTADRHMDCTVS